MLDVAAAFITGVISCSYIYVVPSYCSSVCCLLYRDCCGSLEHPWVTKQLEAI